MPKQIEKILESNILWIIARICLSFLFLSSGLAKLFDTENSFQEMIAAGLEPAWLFNYASAFVLLFSSTLLLLNRYLWLGAGAASVFLFLTILIVHNFWTMSGVKADISMYFALEHIAVIGGLMSVSIASHFRHKFKLISNQKL